MIVSELITELQKLDPELIVTVYNHNYRDYDDVQTLDVVKVIPKRPFSGCNHTPYEIPKEGLGTMNVVRIMGEME